jgi:glycosyltransferase involved in cell wall biosynthesis
MESAERARSDESPSPTTVSRTDRTSGSRIVLCPHISIEHYRGGEKWVVSLANRLAADGVDVSIRALPYVPNDERRVAASEVLDEDVSYRESWRHDLSAFDSAYIFYAPLSNLFFTGDVARIAGIHSWVYVSDKVYESHYGMVPRVVKWLYRSIGSVDLRQFDLVHTVTPAFDSSHPNTVHVPNFVDADRFHPERETTEPPFTVLVTSAHIPEKGWDDAREVAARLPDDIRLEATGTSDDPNVRDLGFLSEGELASAYASAHVVLHPARVDTDSMVINEACASGTPVVTTPLPTHVRENEAILQAGTPGEMVGAIRLLHREWERDAGYDRRGFVAREVGEEHDVDRIYPRLKELLLAPEAVAR